MAAFNEEFQAELNFQLLRLGRERGLSLHVFCPSTNFSANDMRTSQEFILDNADQYSGGLLVASQFADDMVDELHEFAAKLLLPVVFVDHVPPASSGAASPGNVRWVTVRDTSGGEKAVEATADFGIEPKRILVVAGPAKRDRQDAYVFGITQRWPACEVVTTVDGGFNRARTQAIIVRLMREAVREGKMFDVVFCTSDSMTLGCLDALEKIDWINCKSPVLIGYDGTQAMQALVLEDCKAVKRVIVQDPVKLAGTALRELGNLRAARPGASAVWVEPTLFPTR